MQAHRRRFLALAVTGALSLPGSNTQAGENLVADVIDIAPWGRRGANGRVEGVLAEIFRRLEKLSACALDLRLTPIKRAVAEVSENLAQVTMLLEGVDLQLKGKPLGLVTTLEMEVWLPKGSTVRQLSQLEGKIVATLGSPSSQQEFVASNSIIQYPVATVSQQLKMMRLGRVDGALGVRQNFLVALRQLGWESGAFAGPISLGSRRVMLWVSPKLRGQPCAVKLSEALAEMRNSGEIDRLIAEQVLGER